MPGEKDLQMLLKSMKPALNKGDFVFCTVKDVSNISLDDITLFFKEQEGHTLILTKELADLHQLTYSFTAAWITLTVHSSLDAVGLTAAFSAALSKKGISCNVVAAYYHDHIFVDKKDADRAMAVLNSFAA
jgi:uncharacterized protein